MFNHICIWLSTRNWRRFALRAMITYPFMLVGALGVDLIRLAKIPSPPAMIGYALLVASYLATGAVWSK
jgi:hypothetical protein